LSPWFQREYVSPQCQQKYEYLSPEVSTAVHRTLISTAVHRTLISRGVFEPFLCSGIYIFGPLISRFCVCVGCRAKKTTGTWDLDIHRNIWALNNRNVSALDIARNVCIRALNINRNIWALDIWRGIYTFKPLMSWSMSAWDLDIHRNIWALNINWKMWALHINRSIRAFEAWCGIARTNLDS